MSLGKKILGYALNTIICFGIVSGGNAYANGLHDYHLRIHGVGVTNYDNPLTGQCTTPICSQLNFSGSNAVNQTTGGNGIKQGANLHMQLPDNAGAIYTGIGGQSDIDEPNPPLHDDVNRYVGHLQPNVNIQVPLIGGGTATGEAVFVEQQNVLTPSGQEHINVTGATPGGTYTWQVESQHKADASLPTGADPEPDNNPITYTFDYGSNGTGFFLEDLTSNYSSVSGVLNQGGDVSPTIPKTFVYSGNQPHANGITLKGLQLGGLENAGYSQQFNITPYLNPFGISDKLGISQQDIVNAINNRSGAQHIGDAGGYVGSRNLFAGQGGFELANNEIVKIPKTQEEGRAFTEKLSDLLVEGGYYGETEYYLFDSRNLSEDPNWNKVKQVCLQCAEYAYQGATEIEDDKFWNRVEAGGGLVLGGVETVGGGIMVVAPEPVTTVAGVGVVALGVDTMQSSARQLWTGQDTKTLVYEGLKFTGLEDSTIQKAELGLALAGGGKAVYDIGKFVYKGGDEVVESGVDFFKASDEISIQKPDFYVTPEGVTIPSTGYRAIGGERAVNEAIDGVIPSRNPTYITFDDISDMSSSEVKSFLQLPRPPTHIVEFDTLPLTDLSIPKGQWNTTNIPEPITSTLPKYGEGGATQAITNMPININILKEIK